jgi:hypothetical protein
VDTSSLLPARARSILYVVSVMLAAGYAVVEANATLHYGITAAYAMWNAGIAVLAVSNVKPDEVN